MNFGDVQLTRVVSIKRDGTGDGLRMRARARRTNRAQRRSPTTYQDWGRIRLELGESSVQSCDDGWPSQTVQKAWGRAIIAARYLPYLEAGRGEVGDGRTCLMRHGKLLHVLAVQGQGGKSRADLLVNAVCHRVLPDERHSCD